MDARTLTLALDASTYRGTVALLDGATLLGEDTVAMRGATEERLLPAVAAVLARAGAGPRDLTRVVCGAGPGSFTSLRIAGSIAKGLAVAGSIPLVAVSSLLLMVAGAPSVPTPGRYLAVLDAMRDERFVAEVAVTTDAAPELVGGHRLVGAAELEAMARERDLLCVGPLEVRELWPHARGVARLHGAPALVEVPVDRWEPDYGRLAEAQVKWEAAHGRPLAAG